MVREIILFDIDYTLINSQISKELRRERFSKLLGISEEDFSLTEKEYVKKDTGFTDFDPNEYVDFITNKYSVSREDISKIFFDDINFQRALYPDVIASLDKLRNNYSLGIFSEGMEDFQMMKLHRSDILKYFDPKLVFIHRRKLTGEVLSLLPEGCYIVDDNVFVVEALCKTGDCKPIWLNRKKEATQLKCPEIDEIANLEGVLFIYPKR